MMSTAPAVPAQSVPAALSRWADQVKDELRKVEIDRDSLLGRMIAYHLGWVEADGRPADASGKQIRSQLCCWAADAYGAQAQSALSVACALELLHNFTLIHDDVQDGDRIRRGRPTVWSIWGRAQAINAGDALFTLALQTLVSDERNLDAAHRSRVGRLVLEAVIEVAHGQCLDLEYECAPDTPVPAYRQVVELKTGALLGASLEAGAVMGGANNHVRAGVRKAGRLLGVAFQLRDDWLGVWGKSTLTGKSRERDLVRRKLTYPVVVAYDAAGPDQRRELRELYRTQGVEHEPRIRELLDELGASEVTASTAALCAREAVGQLRGCGLALDRVDEFADVAEFLVHRDG